MEPNSTITQIGLYSESDQEVQDLVTRVTKFNLNHLDEPVTLNVTPYEKGDEFIPAPHYKLSFEYPSKDVQKKFWLG